MSKDISVTVTPQGLVREVTIGGHAVGKFIPADAIRLTLGAGDLPRLDITLVPDEIIMKGAASEQPA